MYSAHLDPIRIVLITVKSLGEKDMMSKTVLRAVQIGLFTLVLGGIAVVAMNAISGSSTANASAAEAPPSLPTVETITLENTPMRHWSSFSGRLTAVDSAQLRPLVSGTIEQVLFEDGDEVEQGQTLFVIDPRPFEARLAQARAALQSAESAAQLAETEFNRANALAQNKAVSESIRDNRANDLHIAQSQLASAQAHEIEAALDLEYAYVKAPFSGRVGRAEVTVGNVVQAGPNAPVLTSLGHLERLYAEFDVDEETYFRIVRSRNDNSSEGERALSAIVPVEITIQGQDDRVYQATLYAFDNQLDESSGTIRARAIVPNLDSSLIPGVFANVRIGTAQETSTLLVPERAISVSQSKRFVYVVNADDKVEYREVTLGQSIDGQRVVLSGLSRGERVIVNGIQRVRNDMQVAVASN